MTDVGRLTAELRRVTDGDPWFGTSMAEVLADVDAATALIVPEGEPHSIWQLVRHMTSWARHVAFRVAGGAPGEPAEGDWPAVDGSDESAWSATVDSLRQAHAELILAVQEAEPGVLDAVDAATPKDGQGEPLTLGRAVLGVPQHDAYHLGQIVVLKRQIGRGTPA